MGGGRRFDRRAQIDDYRLGKLNPQLSSAV
jgi:hypothetical protein